MGNRGASGEAAEALQTNPAVLRLAGKRAPVGSNADAELQRGVLPGPPEAPRPPFVTRFDMRKGSGTEITS